MEVTLKIYLVGIAVSLLFQLFYICLAPKVTVKMLNGYILNLLLSWGHVLLLLVQCINKVLDRTGKNKVLWTNKRAGEYKCNAFH